MATTTFHLRVWTRFLVPVEAVWQLKTDRSWIEAEFAPHRFRLGGEGPLEGLAGAPLPLRVESSLAFFGVLPPISWPTELVEWVPRERFRDRSSNRLFREFDHLHLFEPTPDGCRYIDAVTFTPALPAQKLTAILTRRLFLARHRAAARRLKADPQATAVGVLRVLVEGEGDRK